jgi:hypothetical protein
MLTSQNPTNGEQDEAQLDGLLDMAVVDDCEPQRRCKQDGGGDEDPACVAAMRPGDEANSLIREQQEHDRHHGAGERRTRPEIAGPPQGVGQRCNGEQGHETQRTVRIRVRIAEMRGVDGQGMAGDDGFCRGPEVQVEVGGSGFQGERAERPRREVEGGETRDDCAFGHARDAIVARRASRSLAPAKAVTDLRGG